MTERGGLSPVPDDAQIDHWLQERINENDLALFDILQDLKLSIKEKEEAGQPINFAYGKLLNYLASEQYFSNPQRIRLLAAALWELANE